MTPNPRIVVVGSLNLDWTSRVKHLPAPGETVPASSMIQTLGGKGANQAIAAARQGTEVLMIGCLGDDISGSAYREHLRREGIDDRGILTVADASTGTAMITVDGRAENQIIVAGGANGRLSPAHIRCHEPAIAVADLVLVQWEVPLEVVVEALEVASRHGVPVVMNPSPLKDGFPWGRHPIHSLVVNEGEADAIFGHRALTDPPSLREALLPYRISNLVITRGAEPTQLVTAESCTEFPALSVEPLDTVGAGDSFAGAYAACLAAKTDVPASIRFANVAGALATLKEGAQEAIPCRAQIELAMPADVFLV